MIATAYGFGIQQSLPKVDMQIYEGFMGQLLGSIYSTSDRFRKIRKDSNYLWVRDFSTSMKALT